jgi:hypothetical protein
LKSLERASPNTIDESPIGKYSDGKIRKLSRYYCEMIPESCGKMSVARPFGGIPTYGARVESTDKGQLALPFIR